MYIEWWWQSLYKCITAELYDVPSTLPHPSYMGLMNPNAKKGQEPQVVGSGQIVRKSSSICHIVTKRVI
jgi:hypothetical protein